LTAVAAVLSTAVLAAQVPQKHVSGVSEGRKLYGRYCAECHGSDAQGTDRGPKLAGNRSLRKSTGAQVGDVIRHGISDGGMPAFALPSASVDALAAFVHSLNYSASEAGITGDPKVGQRYFQDAGRCASCHTVYGRGSPVGPDLSNVGSEMTVDEIKEALLKPRLRLHLAMTL